MTVSIVGLGVVAIMTSVGSTMRLSGVSREESHADQLLVRYAENLLAVPYEACSSGSTPYTAAAYRRSRRPICPTASRSARPAPRPPAAKAFELSVQSIAYWNGDLSPATFSPTCPSSDAGSQELVLDVHAGDGSFDRTTMIVKRTP